MVGVRVACGGDALVDFRVTATALVGLCGHAVVDETPTAWHGGGERTTATAVLPKSPALQLLQKSSQSASAGS